MSKKTRHTFRELWVILILSLVLTCEDNRDKYGSVKIEILMTSGTDTNSGQNNRITGALSSDVTNITITISGVEPVNVNVASGETVTQTIDGVPLGEQTVKIDLKDADGIILYTQTQTVTVEAGKTVSPTFPADDFTAENVEISVTKPNGGESWELGSLQEITWTTSHLSEFVSISLYKNSVLDIVIIDSIVSNTGYNWNITDTLDENDGYKVRVSSLSDIGVYDESDADFTLFTEAEPTLTITSPSGGEEWQLGSTYDITWTSSDVSGNIKIELYKSGNTYQTIVESIDNDGSYSWTISDSYDEGSEYTIRVSSVSDNSVYDESGGTFTLYSTTQASITVTSPNGGENWELGSTHDITWTSSDVSGNIKIELYKSGSAYQVIEGSKDDNGSYSWTIPDSYDDDGSYKVRISSVSDDSVYDESDNIFTLSTGTQELTWSYTFGDSSNNYYYDFIKTFDGDYVFLASDPNDSSLCASDYTWSCRYLLKTNESGQVEWKEFVATSNQYGDMMVEPTLDGGYVINIVGSYNTFSSVRKYDSQGMEEWYHWASGGPVYDIDIISDGGYIMVGYDSDEGYYLKNLDSNGEEELFTHDFSWEGNPTSVHTTSTPGEYIISGNQWPNGGDGYLSKTYANATEAWTINFDYFIADLLVTDSDEYILLGREGTGWESTYSLIKTDSEGNELWSSPLIPSNDSTYFYYINETLDGGYIISGTTYITPHQSQYYERDIFIVKTDSQGNIEWENSFGGPGSEGGKVFQTDDGGYIFGGYTSSFGNGYYVLSNLDYYTGMYDAWHTYDLWLVKLDSQGNTSE